MKKLIALLVVIATLLTLTFAVSAGNVDGVKKGTPTIDGKFDNIYKDGGHISADPNYIGSGDGPFDHIIKAEDVDGYALWDDSALYFYAVCWDTTPGSGDNFAFFINMDSVTYVPSAKPMTGEITYSDGFDETNSHMVTGYDETNHYFWVEAKLVPKAEHKGSVLYSGNTVQFHFCYWNDINNDGESENFTTSGFFVNNTMKLKGAKAEGTGNDDSYFKAGKAPDGPVTPTTQTPTTTKGGDKPGPAPQTSDSMLIVGAVALCAAAAAVIVAKKKRD